MHSSSILVINALGQDLHFTSEYSAGHDRSETYFSFTVFFLVFAHESLKVTMSVAQNSNEMAHKTHFPQLDANVSA